MPPSIFQMSQASTISTETSRPRPNHFRLHCDSPKCDHMILLNHKGVHDYEQGDLDDPWDSVHICWSDIKRGCRTWRECIECTRSIGTETTGRRRCPRSSSRSGRLPGARTGVHLRVDQLDRRRRRSGETRRDRPGDCGERTAPAANELVMYASFIVNCGTPIGLFLTKVMWFLRVVNIDVVCECMAGCVRHRKECSK